MARIRSIKPEFWEDEQIGLLSRDARLLFIATWNLADDEGLLRWSAPYLKANAFMYDGDVATGDVELLMKELEDAELVLAYLAGKSHQALGWVVNFTKHQHPNRPQPSKLPAPNWQDAKVRAAYGQRDGWLCGICSEEIPRTGFGDFDTPGPSAATKGLSIDHVQARCEGGSDYPSNLRATHKGCNSRKGKHSEPRSELFTEQDSEPVTPVVVVGSGEGGGEGVSTPLSSSTPEPGTELELVTSSPTATGPVETVFAAWRESTGKTRAHLSPERRKVITKALKTYPVDELVDAVCGWRLDPHCRGENDRHTVYNDLELLLRDAKHIEKFRDLARGSPSERAAFTEPRSWQATRVLEGLS